MKSIIFVCLFGFATAGLFDLFGGKSNERAEVHLTRPDTGELGANIGNGNLGAGVRPKETNVDVDHGSEIFIPRNTGVGSGVAAQNRPVTSTATTRRKVTSTTTSRPWTTQRIHITTAHTSHTSRPDVARVLPNQHVSSNNGRCPSRVDAYSPGPLTDFIFDGSNVYTTDGKRVNSVVPLRSAFPGGPASVTAAVYDQDKELILLFNGRMVYGFKTTNDRDVYQLDSTYPKNLPDTIAFSPNAAVRWHDGHQMVLSNGGKFALYDEYWNKSLMTGRTMNYFENLPDRVRGISAWKNGRGFVFTESLVFEYDVARKGPIGEGIPLTNMIQC